jgi:mannose-6-phosphate isomerase-like protein (cupin superfamily)
MSSQPFDLLRTFVHLQNDGHGHTVAVNREFWMGINSRGYDRVLGAFRFETPDDLHADSWEIHPHADEIIVLLSGEIEIVLEQGPKSTRNVPLEPGRAFIVPAGVWHRLVMRAPGELLFINSRRDMDHKPV